MNKDDANAAIDGALAEKNKSIDDAPNLTTEEKQAVKDQAKTEADSAKTAISQASTVTAVASAKKTGVDNINNVNVPTTSATKAAAKDAIDQAAKTKDDAIDASSLTAEEKADLKKTVAGEVQTAKDKIDAATKNADVQTAQTDGEKAINAVEIPTSSKTKNDANSDLKNTADDAKKAIDETSGLTADQKQTAKNQIDKAVTDAQENIKKASDNQGVADAKDAGKLAIDKVSEKAAIDDDLAKKIEEIKANTNLTAEEKAKLTTDANSAANAAKDKIQSATTNDGATKAGQDGKTAIEAVTVPTDSDVKKNANSDLKNTADAAKQAIDKTSGLTADQKQTAKDQIDKVVDAAKENIKKASDNQGVADAKDAGKLAIDKDAANAAIDGALNNKKSEINGATNIDQPTKDNLIKEATDAATKAKDAIDKAKTNNDVATEQTKGTNAIDAVKVPSLTDSQTAAKQAIDDALNNKKSEINGATNIDQPTKDNLIKEATDAADAAKKAIDQATTADAIKTAKDDGISNINNLNQGTDATKDNVQNSNSNGKVTNVDDQGNTTITYSDGSKSTISGDDYAYNDFYQVIIKANAVQVYTLPKGNLTKEKKLVHDTTLTVLETKKIDGQVWYRIGTNRWIMAATTIKVGEPENFKLKRLSKKTKTTAIVWVNKLAIYNNVNGKMTKKHLTRGTKVRIYAIATINDGEWYKIGKNKWIPAAGVHELTVEPL
nr:DUF1542 domain-containing protein [Lactobacillus kitasatonis]